MNAPAIAASDATPLAHLLARIEAVESGLRELRDARRIGWKAVAAGLRCSVRTAQRYAERAEDRLPVWAEDGRDVWIWESALRDWAGRHHLPYHAAQRMRDLEQEVQRLLRDLATARGEGTPQPETTREASTGVVRRRPRA